ncbi:MAG: tetratricopeptide repeat protein [Candidatus Melainabacteria bacterium]|nr:tetratricopeptide repeat protein [Candidatus Melainabacteria bacterium]
MLLARAALITVTLLFSHLPVGAQTTAGEWLQKARNCKERGDDKGSSTACNSAIRLDPNNVEAWTLRADANLPWALAGTTKAQKDYARVLQLDPKNYYARSQLGFLTLELMPSGKQELTKAVADLKALPHRTPEQERLYAYASNCLSPKTALPVVQRFCDSNPNDAEAWYFLACSLDAVGKVDAAKIAFKKNQKLLEVELKRHCTGYIGKQVSRGCATLQDYQAGVALFSTYLEKHPDNVHALYWRGCWLNALGRAKPAIKDIAKSVELNPSYLSHLRYLGEIDLAQKNYTEAANIFQQIILRDPGAETYVVKRALCLKELKQESLALQELNNYLARDPAAVAILRTKANLEKKRNPDLSRQDLQRALSVISQQIQAAPGYHQYYTRRAELYVDCSEPDNALAELDRAISLKPDDATLFYTRANLKWTLDLKNEAIADQIRAVDCALTYQKRAHLLVLGSFYNQLHQYDKAIAVANQCIAINPNVPDGYRTLVSTHIEQKNFPTALADLQRIAALKVPLDDLDYLFGKVYIGLNKPKQALTAFNTSLNRHPRDLGARMARGELHKNREQYELALVDFNKALELAPDYGYAYHSRALTYAGMGEYTKAANDISEAMKLLQWNEASWVLEDRARFYTYAERYNEAAADLAKAYRYALNKPIYLYQCGKLLYWAGNKLGAIEKISAYLNRVPDRRALRARARCYFETNQFEKSIMDYSSLLEEDPENPILYRMRAKAYAKHGNDRLATADTNKAKTFMKSR